MDRYTISSTEYTRKLSAALWLPGYKSIYIVEYQKKLHTLKNSVLTKDCVCVYTPVFTLAAKEINLLGSTKSYLVEGLLGCFREDTLAKDCDAKWCNC